MILPWMNWSGAIDKGKKIIILNYNKRAHFTLQNAKESVLLFFVIIKDAFI
jgi:hypothetical protein